MPHQELVPTSAGRIYLRRDCSDQDIDAFLGRMDPEMRARLIARVSAWVSRQRVMAEAAREVKSALDKRNVFVDLEVAGEVVVECKTALERTIEDGERLLPRGPISHEHEQQLLAY